MLENRWYYRILGPSCQGFVPDAEDGKSLAFRVDLYYASALMNASDATKPGTSVVEEAGLTHLPLYKVILHNDDVNTTEHVIRALMTVFRFARQRAEGIMLEAHQSGGALCAVEPFEQAEHHRDQLHAFSLTATIERE